MKKIAIIFAVAVTIAALFGFYMYQKPRASLVDTRPEYRMSPDQLVTAFQSDEQSANRKYLGKVIEVSGKIFEIKGDEEGSVNMLLETSDLASFILCTMDIRSWSHEGLYAGDSVAVKGKCTGWLMDVVLTGCVVVEKAGT